MKKELSLLVAGAFLAGSLFIFSGCIPPHGRHYRSAPRYHVNTPRYRHSTPRYYSPGLYRRR